MSEQLTSLGIIALSSAGLTNASAAPSLFIPVAATKAGGIGCLDLEFVRDLKSVPAAVEDLVRLSAGPCGIKCSVGQLSDLEPALSVLGIRSGSFSNRVILSTADCTDRTVELRRAVSLIHNYGLLAVVEAVSIEEALLAESAGADAVIAKGHEAGGRIGEETTFILLQRFAGRLKIPVWAQGGIGLHTAAAARAAGAAGVVLDSQLLLTRESPLSLASRARVGRLDGSETVCLGARLGESYRFLARAGSGSQEEIFRKASELESGLNDTNLVETRGGWRQLLSENVIDCQDKEFLDSGISLIGQDVAFAASLAGRFSTVAGVLKALRQAADEQLRQAAELKPLAEGSALASSHNTRYPIVQGAMTRVSDRAEFAHAVAEGGALPFLALALMRGPEVDKLMSETRESLKDRPWGVGILGFVPRQLRDEQLEVVTRYKPPFALIAGGRPDQAKSLEDIGIATYLHVPSPLLLKTFIEAGTRRFIFEGRECGGHVGPRSSFVLWESMIEVLLDSVKPGEQAADYHILFAGGVHDDLSAAMVAALAAPLAARGMRVGALLGTAYLFTSEAVSSGAIVEKFQSAALECDRTVLFETGPGHAIRCIESPYKDTFDSHRLKLEQENNSKDAVRLELELMNLGRLRIASKGVARAEGESNDRSGQEMVALPKDKQWSEGMYMIGQIAAMRREVIPISKLHHEISHDSAQRLDRLRKSIESSHEASRTARRKERGEDIAIVGMSCLFAKAGDLETYWQNILNKVDAITEVPKEHWDWEKLFDADRLARDKVYSKWGGFLEDIPFNPTEWGIPPSSLPYIDPMQLILLAVARAAIADAGYAGPDLPKERTSVLLANAGHGPITSMYLLRSMFDWKMADLDPAIKEHYKSALPEWTEDSFPGLLGNVAAGRVANRFDFGGINFSIDAACASSLAALYTGVADLRAGNSDVVLLAAVDTHNQPIDYLSFSKTHALSPRGRCRTFDQSADGIVISEGAAVLMLKRLSDAETDGDHIYSVIKEVGGSSDGRDLSLTAPRLAGQVLALKRAYENSGISPHTVELIEAHGTGTVVGDKTEVEALRQVFEESGAARQSCAIGSVKTMIGHTKAAAGLASLIKIAKALHHKIIPPTIGVEQPSPACKFGEGPFYLSTETRPWFKSLPNIDLPRRAGVSAFGFGGTNFHVVLEEHEGTATKQSRTSTGSWPAELFIWRANSNEELVRALDAVDRQAQDSLKAESEPENSSLNLDQKHSRSLAALSCSHYLNSARRGGDVSAAGKDRSSNEEIRLSIVATSLQDLREKITQAKTSLTNQSAKTFKDPRGIYLSTQVAQDSAKKIAFLFPGQGSQQINMLADLSMHFSEVRDAIFEGDRVLKDRIDRTLSSFIYPPPTFDAQERKQQEQDLTNTHIAQPAVAVGGLGILHLLSAFRISPDMVAGHSFGEYIALSAAGAITDRDLISIAEKRGQILAETNASSQGSMAAVSADQDTVARLAAAIPGIYLANVNAPSQCIIAGDRDAIERAIKDLTEQGIRCRPIPVSAAFHSPLIASAQNPLADAFANIHFEAPELPVFSNTDALPYKKRPDAIATHLLRHLVEPVRFAAEIEAMHEAGARIFIEAGPGSVLTGLTDAILADKPHLCVSVDRNSRNGVVQLLHALAELSSHGVPLEIGRLFQGRFSQATEMSLLENQHNGPGSTSKSPRSNMTFLINSSAVARPGQKPEKGTLLNNEPQKPASTPAVKQAITPAAKPVVAPAAKQAIAPAAKPQAAPAAAPAAPLSAQPPRQVSPQANRASTPNRAVPQLSRASSVDQVMVEFQKSMLQMTTTFLETQERVMLAYLQSGGTIGTNAATPGKVIADLASQPMLSIPHATIDNSAPVLEYVEQTQNGADEFDSVAATNVEPTAGEVNAEAAPEDDKSAVNADYLIASLLDIVSQRTGYPPSMLDPKLDLEADLGVDSIKRIEILSGFRKLLPESKQTEIEGSMEKLAGIKTLQGITDWIRSEFDGSVPVQDSGAVQAISFAPDPVQAASPPESTAKALQNVVSRGLIKVIEPPPVSQQPFTCPGAILIADDETGTGVALAGKLRARGHCVVLARHKKGLYESDSEAHYVDFGDDHAVRNLSDRIRDDHGTLGSIIHLLSLSEAATDITTQSLFLLASCNAPDFKQAPAEPVTASRPAIFAVTALGGAFGSSEDGQSKLPAGASPLQAGIVGAIKSIAKEWTHIFGRAIDLAPELPPEQVAELVLSELDSPDSVVEVGYLDGRRITLDVNAAPLSSSPAESRTKAPLSDSSVVLVTGGARGITAQICLELAEKYKPTLVIIGRLPRPQDEDPALAGLTSARELKAAIIEQVRRDGKSVQINQIEAAYQKLMREREIRSNLEMMSRLGAKIEYHAVDVRDDGAFGDVIDKIYKVHGRLDGVIHGAGVIEDALIKDKSWTSFERVFDTKVKSAFTLKRKLRLESLKFLYFFSSVVGRTGNAGQTDYVAANEVLNKLAIELDARTTARVSSLLWGPWLGGMAPPELEAVFASHGWAMIEPDGGRRAFIKELESGRKGEIEVLLVGKLEQARLPEPSGARMYQSSVSQDTTGAPVFKVVLDPKIDLYLNDHKFDNVPVMPMAVSLELMAEAASAAYPDFELKRVHNLQIPAGIVFESGTKQIEVIIIEERRTDKQIFAQAAVTTGNELRRTHFKALLEFSKETSAIESSMLPAIARSSLEAAVPMEHPESTLPERSEIYSNWLFHGPIFQGIQSIHALAISGIIGEISRSAPSQCLSATNGEDWKIDPVLLDSAMQLAGVWARHTLDITVLPTGFHTLHRLRPLTSSNLTARVFIPKERHDNELLCDLVIYESDGMPAMVVEGLGGIGSRTLNRLSVQSEVSRSAK